MAIGLDRSAGYFFAGTTGTLNEPGQSIALYVVALLSFNLSKTKPVIEGVWFSNNLGSIV
jgi:hypothetical protein